MTQIRQPENAILLHACCGPCSITPVLALRDAGHEPTLWWFNPNIHPLSEYLRRREGLGNVAARLNVAVIYADEGNPAAADPGPWLMRVAALGEDMAQMSARCPLCYAGRLVEASKAAARLGFARFSTTLLYSKYQRHEDIMAAGRDACQGVCLAGSGPDVRFHYQDFRPGWSEGIRLSKEWGVYRQQYCGCLLSEHDRYRRDLEKICIKTKD
jgi:Uncharacterized protein conserved in bacteria